MVIASSKTIAINTIAAYLRMLLCGVLTLFSSRWILHALGEVDYGLYFLIWGAVGAMAFFTGAMAMSAQRHLAYSIGEGDATATNRWFNASVAVHLGLGVLLVVTGLLLGNHLIGSWLNIPAERLAVSQSVFNALLVTVFIRVLITPYLGFLTAKQRIFELSLWQMLQTLAVFVFSYFLVRVSGDRLLAYTLWVTGVSIVIALLQFLRCQLGFGECKLGLNFQRSYCRELLTFGGWNLFGALSAIGSRQGTAFLINIFCGAEVNASYGFANQVGDTGEGVAMGLSNAMLPEITSSEGRGERERVVALALLSSKLAVLLFCLLLIPLIGELDTLLRVWLQDVPEHTAGLCVIVLLSLLIDKLTIGYMAALFAKGQIAGYQASLGSIGLCAPLIGWVLFSRGYGIEASVGCALLIPRTVATLGRLFWAKRLMDIPLARWCTGVLLPCVLALALPALLMFIIALSFDATLVRAFVSFAGCSVALVAGTWLGGLNAQERVIVTTKWSQWRGWVGGSSKVLKF